MKSILSTCLLIILLCASTACNKSYNNNIDGGMDDMVQSAECVDIENLRHNFLYIFEDAEHQLNEFISIWRESSFLYDSDRFTIIFATEHEIAKGMHRWTTSGLMKLVILNGEALDDRGRYSTSIFLDYFHDTSDLMDLLHTFEIDSLFSEISFTRNHLPGDTIRTSLSFHLRLEHTEFVHDFRPDVIPSLPSTFRFLEGAKDNENPNRLNLNASWQVLIPSGDEHEFLG